MPSPLPGATALSDGFPQRNVATLQSRDLGIMPAARNAGLSMETAAYTIFDPLFPEHDAQALVRVCEAFGSYGMYARAPVEEELGRGLFQRHDAATNYIRSGGRFGHKEHPAAAAFRTNYFRETYAYAEPLVPGIERFLHHDGFVDAARSLYGRRVVVPAIVYANLLIPGQELAVHTDVPEFRGCNRTKDPEWLMVAMHHSGLFEPWRMPIATAVSWFGSCRGGEFAFYPAGADAPPTTIPARHDTAILLDTDSVFHGVDRVEESVALPVLNARMRLTYEGSDRWRLGEEGQAVARYAWDDIRFSISWKAYCFADEAELRVVREHSDDLTRTHILDLLLGDLCKRGRIQGDTPKGRALALLLIDEYIRFPKSAPEA
jgi:hypothetical protein